MSASMPELGSKISLISKADIRYEGRLFTVDPQECTIALATVRSFGTEDRETQFPVAPQNQIYEYILFRGSDIKDIRVVNNVNTIPNDPAIVQMTVPPSMGTPAYQPQPAYGHPMMGGMGPMGGQYGPPYGMAMGAMGPVMTMPTAARDPRIPMNKPPSVLDLISGGSRSTTPTSSLLTRKSPSMDQNNQVGHQQNQQQGHGANKTAEKLSNRAVHPPTNSQRNGSNRGRSGSGLSHYSDGKREAVRDDNQRHNRQMQPQQQHQPQQQQHQHHHQQQQQQQQQQSQMGRGNRGGWMPRGGMLRGRGRGRGVFSQNQAGPGGKPKNQLKFDNDYDFEQANTEFEELRSRLAKTKIDAGTENEKKDDSGNETGAGEGEPEEEPDVIHYDKAKSFFDNISCEAVERSKGRSQRTDWRTERKLNSETFGVASTRRGGYRGNRGYYNRGMGSYRGNPGGSQAMTGGMNHGGGGNGSGYRGNYRGNRGNMNNRKRGQSSGTNAGQNFSNNEQNPSQSLSSSARLVTGTA